VGAVPPHVDDLPARYHEYLERFTATAGDVRAGAFVKYSGRLIKKLTFEEFTPAYLDFNEIAARYQDSVDRGDTINDIVLRLLRDQAANLLLTPPG
jgi:hypothetical protein